MGLEKTLMPFDLKYIQNKQLILSMLEYEDKLFLSKEGQQFLSEYGSNTKSLEGSKSIQRKTLNNFGFESSDTDLANYRKIFHHYYTSSTDYDPQILNSVYYMRENRCLYYKSKPLELGTQIPNLNVFGLDGKTQYDLHNLIKTKNYSKTILAAFSLS
jgi:hypothetical protein